MRSARSYSDLLALRTSSRLRGAAAAPARAPTVRATRTGLQAPFVQGTPKAIPLLRAQEDATSERSSPAVMRGARRSRSASPAGPAEQQVQAPAGRSRSASPPGHQAQQEQQYVHATALAPTAEAAQRDSRARCGARHARGRLLARAPQPRCKREWPACCSHAQAGVSAGADQRWLTGQQAAGPGAQPQVHRRDRSCHARSRRA